MPHFDPRRSTTEDVVRGAIIPLSAERKSAFVHCAGVDGATRPRSLVTHHWQNVFTDLVAAVAADVVGEPFYERLSAMLENSKACYAASC